MAVPIAIIADDLTGALDAAAPFARRGARARVVISPEHLAGVLARGDLPDVLAVNTESRHLSATHAAERVSAALDALLPLEPRLLFKKVDSTLRGHVVAECLAARQACDRPLLIASAVPAQGRTVRGGHVFVHGEPLASSAYGRDARSTPPAEALHTLFARQGLGISVLPAASAIGSGDCLLDAESEADLDAIAAQLFTAAPHWLAVGAAGLAEAVARTCFTAQGASAESFDVILFAVGSRCPQARRQIEHLRDSMPDLPVLHAMERDGGSLTAGTGALLIPERDVTSRFTPEQVARHMADRIVDAVAHAEGPPPLLFLTGGDTAMAAMQRLGVRQVEVAGEWAPGVAWGWLDGDRHRPVMTKAGGFGDDALLVRLLEASTTRG